MKKFIVLASLLISLTGCLGNSSNGNAVIGQVKMAQHVTPIVFADYHRVDISLGVLRNGVGSVSKEDLLLYVPNDADFAVLQKAAQTGEIVKLTYSTARFRWYVEESYVTSAEIAQ